MTTSFRILAYLNTTHFLDSGNDYMINQEFANVLPLEAIAGASMIVQVDLMS